MTNDEAWFVLAELSNIYTNGNKPGATARLQEVNPERVIVAISMVLLRLAGVMQKSMDQADQIIMLEKQCAEQGELIAHLKRAGTSW